MGILLPAAMTAGLLAQQAVRYEPLYPSIFRRQLLMPAEHGSWAWLLFPFFAGVLIAGLLNLPVALTLVAGLAGFLLRQPATIWLRVQQGRARRGDGPVAAGWVIALLVIVFVCLFALLVLGRTALLWLGAPLVVLLGLYLAAAYRGRAGTRALWMEVAGAAALSLMAPAAIVAATGRLESWVWILWALFVGQNVLGALYVRLRLYDTRNRPLDRGAVMGWHVLALVAVLTAAFTGAAPLATAVPFLAFLLRAGWAVARPRPVENVRRFGFTELGIEALSSIWIAASYWM